MTDAIAHRGPDSDGHWWDREAGIAVGMRRLAIMDLSPAGEQPMFSASGRYAMVFNGEIYNYRDIRAELEQQGRAPTWQGHSDSEVLLAAIEAWGLEPALCASNGMLAVAIWDRQERTLQLAVDRFGEKPLYYGWMADTFLFGSELKALRAHPAWAGDIDQQALAQFFRLRYIPAPASIFKGIRKLVPGTIATLHWGTARGQRKELETRNYWSLHDLVSQAKQSPPQLTDIEALDQFETLLTKAVGQRMESDVPLGAFLSGGIDSSAIVALMQKQSSRPIRTFAIGFTDPRYDESERAEQVAAHLGTHHVSMVVTPKEAMDVIPRLPAIYDEPMADNSQIPTFLVSELTRRHVTVALTGDAGDELLGGYNHYFRAQRILPMVSRIPRGLRYAAAGAIRGVGVRNWNKALRTVMPATSLDGRSALKFTDLLSQPSPQYRSLLSSWEHPSELGLTAKEPPTAFDDPDAIPPGLSFFEQMMYLDMVTYLPGDILAKVDRATMAASLEGRVPFLDPEVVKFAWQLPLSSKIKGNTGKQILRQLVYRHVPREIMDRPKSGFSIPVGDWLRSGPLRGWADALLTPANLAGEGFAPGVVTRIWDEHCSGAGDWYGQLWPMLMYLSWKKEFDRASTPTHAAASIRAVTPTPTFSFVIPTYNREGQVDASIRSALAWIDSRTDAEIVVVDDCSTDGTLEKLRREFAPEIEVGNLRLVALPRNSGVSRAKNAGAREAMGQWLIFLDSDDLMVASSAQSIRHAIRRNPDFGILFFRCEKMADSTLIGAPQDGPIEVDVRRYVNRWTFGECLPILRRDAFPASPYDESMNGWEGIAYARLLRDGGRGMVIPTVARKYRTDGDDRLSSRAGMRRRSRTLAKGHWIFLREFGAHLTPINFIRQIIKVVFFHGSALWLASGADRV